MIFFFFIGLSPIIGFLPTIAKQLGYSPFVVGSLFTYLSILAFLVKPIVGYIVDKYRVKKILFLTFVLSCGLTAFLLNFVEKTPSENVVDLNCDKSLSMNVCTNKQYQCDDSLYKVVEHKNEAITCKVRRENIIIKTMLISIITCWAVVKWFY